MHTEAAIQEFFERYMKIAADPQAAATLVLAHVTREASESAPDGNLTVKQAAKQLGVSIETVYLLCSSGQLRHQKIGRAVRISPTDLADYRQSATQAPTNQPLRCLSL